MSEVQKAEAHGLRQKWDSKEFHRFRFWIKDDGHVSRRMGHHRLTQAAGAEIDAMLRGEPVRSKGDLAGYTTATFHTSKP
jgi:hypothetical protein